MAGDGVSGFKCILADRNIRVFAAAIGYLGRIGKDIKFEAHLDHVSSPAFLSPLRFFRP